MLRRHLAIKEVFTPNTFSPALWLDASDQSTMYQERTGASATTLVSSDADPIGTWKDKSGNGRHVTAPSDAARPTFKAAIQNGRSVARFDGVNDILQGLVTMGISGAAYRTLFTVQLEYTSSNFPPVYIHGQNGIAGSTFSHMFYPTKIHLDIWGASLLGATINPGQWSVVSSQIRTADNTGLLWRNGTAATGSTGVVNTNDNRHAVGGVYGGSSQNVATDIAEIIYYPSNLSTSQRQQVERYLANKWGITLS